MCLTLKTWKILHLISGQRQDDSFLFIINTVERRQGVRISRCLNPSKACHMGDAFPNHYRTECKQQYVYRELLALSNDGQAMKEKFKFPACCSCVLHRK